MLRIRVTIDTQLAASKMLNVTPIPILHDNYVWVIQAQNSQSCIIVDPGAAENLIHFLTRKQLTLAAILVTHSHYDHVDGINELLNFQDAPVYGPQSTSIPQVTIPVSHASTFSLCGAQIRTIHVPGHMPEHLAYIIEHQGTTQVFSGDVLFSSGCGRIFVGSHEELKASLDHLKSLPDETIVYPTHEYTLANLAFAHAVEPLNEDIQARQKKVVSLRNQGAPSLPTSIAQEKRVNPFLRCDQKSVISAVAARLASTPRGELEVFTGLRCWKDEF